MSDISIPYWVIICKALVTPAIAILALYVAYQQWRTNHNKFRLDYFNRRYPIYEAAMRLVSGIAMEGKVTRDEIIGYTIAAREAEFFFNSDIKVYCDKLRSEANKILMGQLKIETGPVSARGESADLLQQRLAWFNDQVVEIPKKFCKYLKIKE